MSIKVGAVPARLPLGLRSAMYVLCVSVCEWVRTPPLPAGSSLHAARNDQRTNFIYLFPGLLDHGLRLQLLIGERPRARIEVAARRRHRERCKSRSSRLGTLDYHISECKIKKTNA